MKYKLIALLFIASITASSCKKKMQPEGVTLELANERKENITDVKYKLHFDIPETKAERVKGKAEIWFTANKSKSLVIDFRGSTDALIGVSQNNEPINYSFENGHITISKRYIKTGNNSFNIEFVSGDGSLNRSEEFLYSLLVPDRASTVFPCFDQPDQKAVFELTLTLPISWTAVSNGSSTSLNNFDDKKYAIHFEATKPISTYLFAFAAGKFQKVTETIGNWKFSVYHRETDLEKLKRNLPVVFDLHAKSLDWLEEYTQIPYPFGKLDFVLIPGFQYSGMEHPGAIFYRDSRLLLDENPSVNQKLRQANLIAHEVAHQWFGDLVTMRWFNDVWLKEVFAGYMADLMVNPQYPEINHQLSFMLSHFPRAYSVDRTDGANPIVQQLDNMLFAGTLYGDIIYHKAPIMMQQLVMLMGSEPFKLGVREYLKQYYMGNASWDELISILATKTNEDLTQWASVWTKRVGRPSIGYKIDNLAKNITLTANDSIPFAPMFIDIIDPKNSQLSQNIFVNTLPSTFQLEIPVSESNNLIVNASGLGYGAFIGDSVKIKWLLQNINQIENPVTRGSVHISVFEAFLEGHIDKNLYITFLLTSIEKEKEAQILSYILGNVETVFWQFIQPQNREFIGKKIENELWRLLEGNLPLDQKKTVLRTLSSVFVTNESFSKMHSAWIDAKVMGISISENDRTKLGYELMIRKPELYHSIALGEIERISNPDRIAQFEFTLNAVSPNPSQRIIFFENLKIPSNRKPEPWVTEALYFLNHPLRADFSLRFIEPSLDLLPEIQRTGDIFFPKSWLEGTLKGHSSPEALQIVNLWISKNPTLASNLKMKLLQSMDMLERTGKR